MIKESIKFERVAELNIKIKQELKEKEGVIEVK